MRSCLLKTTQRLGRTILILVALFASGTGTAANDTVADSTAPKTGMLLVAAPAMSDPNFAATVVLIIAHHGAGSLGLVLNHQTETPVQSVFEHLDGLVNRAQMVRIGGPLDGHELRVLIRSEASLLDAERLFDNVYLATGQQIRRFLREKPPTSPLERIYFAGYAGWSPGQLDREIARGDWQLMQASAELIFSTEPATLWLELSTALAGRWVLGENEPTVNASAM